MLKRRWHHNHQIYENYTTFTRTQGMQCINCIKDSYKILCKHNKKSTRCHIDRSLSVTLNWNISQLSLINRSCYCKAQQEASHSLAQVFISAKKMHVTVNSKIFMGFKRLRKELGCCYLVAYILPSSISF